MLRCSDNTASQGPALLRPPGHSEPLPQLQTWEPMTPVAQAVSAPDAEPAHRPEEPSRIGSQCTRPPRPTRPPPPLPSQASPLVRFQPDRPRQPELLRQLGKSNLPPPQASPSVRPRQPPELKPYQLKPKRGQETFIEPPVEQIEVSPSNANQIKCMKKN